MKNKIVFLGTKPLGEAVLKYLLEIGAEIQAIVTKPKGEGWWGDTKIIEIANNNSIPIYFDHSRLPKRKYDIAISCLYFKIIEKEFINQFRYLINLHMGELPRYRGTNCTAHAIMNARKDDYWYAGVTLHYINTGIDSGNIIDKELVPFDNSTTNYALYKKVELKGFELFKKWAKKIIDHPGKLPSIPQKNLIDIFNPCYIYYRNSLEQKILKVDSKKEIITFYNNINSKSPLSENNFNIKNIKNLLELWDFIRALHFPPFEPAKIKYEQEIYDSYVYSPELIKVEMNHNIENKECYSLNDFISIIKGNKSPFLKIKLINIGEIFLSKIKLKNWKNIKYKSLLIS